MRSLFHPFYIILYVTILSCASQEPPTGGPVDQKPPVLVKVSPENHASNQRPQKITFTFDENIVVTSPDKNIIISPDPGKYHVTKTNHSITIHLNTDSLLPNTTYSVFLNETISDIHEGNKGTYQPFLFSTGNQLDTFFLYGSVKNHPPLKSENYKIVSYSETNEKTGPFYKNKLNQYQFFLGGIDSNQKEIIIYNDQNNNNLADSIEEIGYLHNAKPGADSIHVDVYSRTKKNIAIYENNSLKYFSGIQPFLFNNLQYTIPSTFFYKDTLITLRHNLPVVLSTFSSNYYIRPTLLDVTKKITLQHYPNTDILDSSQHITLIFNQPILGFKEEQIKLRDKTDTNTFYSVSVQASLNRLTIHTSSALKNAQLFIPVSSIRFENELTNTHRITEDLEKPDSRGALHLKNVTESPLAVTIIANKLQYYIYLQPGESKTIYVSRGTCDIDYFEDSNSDLHLTPPDPAIKKAGEKMNTRHGIFIKPGLVNEIELK